jgi:hypothetical protein
MQLELSKEKNDYQSHIFKVNVKLKNTVDAV